MKTNHRSSCHAILEMQTSRLSALFDNIAKGESDVEALVQEDRALKQKRAEVLSSQGETMDVGIELGFVDGAIEVVAARKNERSESLEALRKQAREMAYSIRAAIMAAAEERKKEVLIVRFAALKAVIAPWCEPHPIPPSVMLAMESIARTSNIYRALNEMESVPGPDGPLTDDVASRYLTLAREGLRVLENIVPEPLGELRINVVVDFQTGMHSTFFEPPAPVRA